MAALSPGDKPRVPQEKARLSAVSIRYGHKRSVFATEMQMSRERTEQGEANKMAKIGASGITLSSFPDSKQSEAGQGTPEVEKNIGAAIVRGGSTSTSFTTSQPQPTDWLGGPANIVLGSLVSTVELGSSSQMVDSNATLARAVLDAPANNRVKDRSSIRRSSASESSSILTDAANREGGPRRFENQRNRDSYHGEKKATPRLSGTTLRAVTARSIARAQETKSEDISRGTRGVAGAVSKFMSFRAALNTGHVVRTVASQKKSIRNSTLHPYPLAERSTPFVAPDKPRLVAAPPKVKSEESRQEQCFFADLETGTRSETHRPLCAGEERPRSVIVQERDLALRKIQLGFFRHMARKHAAQLVKERCRAELLAGKQCVELEKMRSTSEDSRLMYHRALESISESLRQAIDRISSLRNKPVAAAGVDTGSTDDVARPSVAVRALEDRFRKRSDAVVSPFPEVADLRKWWQKQQQTSELQSRQQRVLAGARDQVAHLRVTGSRSSGSSATRSRSPGSAYPPRLGTALASPGLESGRLLVEAQPMTNVTGAGAKKRLYAIFSDDAPGWHAATSRISIPDDGAFPARTATSGDDVPTQAPPLAVKDSPVGGSSSTDAATPRLRRHGAGTIFSASPGVPELSASMQVLSPTANSATSPDCQKHAAETSATWRNPLMEPDYRPRKEENNIFAARSVLSAKHRNSVTSSASEEIAQDAEDRAAPQGHDAPYPNTVLGSTTTLLQFYPDPRFSSPIPLSPSRAVADTSAGLSMLPPHGLDFFPVEIDRPCDIVEEKGTSPDKRSCSLSPVLRHLRSPVWRKCFFAHCPARNKNADRSADTRVGEASRAPFITAGCCSSAAEVRQLSMQKQRKDWQQDTQNTRATVVSSGRDDPGAGSPRKVIHPSVSDLRSLLGFYRNELARKARSSRPGQPGPLLRVAPQSHLRQSDSTENVSSPSPHFWYGDEGRSRDFKVFSDGAVAPCCDR